METIPRIYVASLSDYNDSTLHGIWIDATSNVEEMNAAITAMLKASPFAGSTFAKQYGMTAEEWAIHDYEGFGDWKVSEYTSISEIAAFMGLVEAMDNEYTGDTPAIELVAAWLDNMGESPSKVTTDQITDGFQGTWDSFQDYADQYAHDCVLFNTDYPDLSMYFDYKAFARDLQHHYYTADVTGGVAIWNN